MTDLNGHIAFVTGAASGIGAASAAALAAAGASVAVVYFDDPDAAAVKVAAVEEAGARGVAIHADVCDEAFSPGPLLTSDPDMPVMFYNGATQDARWRIGWVAFNRDCTKVIDRCIEPLIVPPPPGERTGIDIAFAASVVVRDNCAHLYYSLADRKLFRAIVRRS